MSDFATLLKRYRVGSIVGDRFAGMWPRERFSVHGIEYQASAKPKSDLYRDMLPILNGGRAELLDHPKIVSQLCSLERRTARGGKDSIDHPPGQHDDVANAVAGALTGLIAQPPMKFAAPIIITSADVAGAPHWAKGPEYAATTPVPFFPFKS